MPRVEADSDTLIGALVPVDLGKPRAWCVCVCLVRGRYCCIPTSDNVMEGERSIQYVCVFVCVYV